MAMAKGRRGRGGAWALGLAAALLLAACDDGDDAPRTWDLSACTVPPGVKSTDF